jgi:hypothetical protein
MQKFDYKKITVSKIMEVKQKQGLYHFKKLMIHPN